MARPLAAVLVNLMPDAALAATERQFARLLEPAACGFRLRFVGLPGIPRAGEADRRVAADYRDQAWLRSHAPDVLLISGANVSSPALEEQAFWPALADLLTWARAHAPAVVCSCLATHAALQHLWGQRRRPLDGKLWGVYDHAPAGHPLLRGMPAAVPVPHSRWNAVDPGQFAAAGLTVLLESGRAGVHLATDADARWLLFQGHPEYDPVSLLKEHKREMVRHLAGARADRPPLPENYLDPAGEALLRDHAEAAVVAAGAGRAPADYPEAAALVHVRDTWSRPAAVIMQNWLAGLPA